MLRIGLIATILALLASAANAQSTVWNPNSPRGRRNLVANPPAPAAATGPLFGTVAPSPWGSLGSQVGQPTWGAVGAFGWTSPETPTWQVGR